MKIAAVFLLLSTLALADVARIEPAAAAKLITEGKAVLVDVREPAEWAESGVATPAILLAKSDFDAGGVQWQTFLAGVGDKQIIVYCRTGRRSEAVAGALAKKGFKVLNAGGFDAWQRAELPVRKVGR